VSSEIVVNLTKETGNVRVNDLVQTKSQSGVHSMLSLPQRGSSLKQTDLYASVPIQNNSVQISQASMRHHGFGYESRDGVRDVKK
jgi:hypothetical protein